MDQSGPEITVLHVVFAVAGAAAMLGVGVLVLASGLVAPLWAVASLVTLWVVAAMASAVAWRRRPWMPLLAAVAIAGASLGAIWLGESLLGWQA